VAGGADAMMPWKWIGLLRRANSVADTMRGMTMKSRWRSKTHWFNLVSAIVVLAQYVGGLDILPPDILAFVIAGGNGVLRELTSQGFSSRKVEL
tara:strand:+ start:8923 stop:9204 length:282 start_codon:yes stop_codon:yes gene_type:complete